MRIGCAGKIKVIGSFLIFPFGTYTFRVPKPKIPLGHRFSEIVYTSRFCLPWLCHLVGMILLYFLSFGLKLSYGRGQTTRQARILLKSVRKTSYGNWLQSKGNRKNKVIPRPQSHQAQLIQSEKWLPLWQN